MPANNAISVTSLDFDTIREGLKTYIAAKPEFADYNFEGSGMALFLDILAYNTYQNAFYSNMIGNEMFLDSAQLRDSVVSRAKAIGYTPRSARGARTTLDVTIQPNDSPTVINIDKNTEFSVTLDGENYTFVTPAEYAIYANNGVYSGTITIAEGTPLTHRFTVSNLNPLSYIIPNENVDTSSISVKVQVSDVDPTTETYTLADNITEVGANSAVYFLQEVEENQYEIYFGDGVLGKQPDNGNIVIIDYRVCNGSLLNNISGFTGPGTLGSYSDYTIEVNEATTGGANNESIESIKFNAPKNFETQNRAVLAEDYKRIILRDRGDIQSLRVWGGQDNNPPVYGKVFVAAKPVGGTILSNTAKDEIKILLRKYNVMSIDVEFIDPTYTYIIPDITVYYDSTQTTLSAGGVRNKVVSVIQNFENTYLGTFDNMKFKYSNFVSAVDNADSSIVNNFTNIELQKRFTPNFGTATKYTINFNTPIEDITKGFTSIKGIPTAHPGGGVAIKSTAFVYANQTCYLDDDGFGNVRIYYLASGGSKLFVTRSAGTVDYATGLIILTDFNPTSAEDDEIRVTVTPDHVRKGSDIIVEKNQLMLLSDTRITMVDENTSTVSPAVTVSTTGSVTQINETAIGTLV